MWYSFFLFLIFNGTFLTSYVTAIIKLIRQEIFIQSKRDIFVDHVIGFSLCWRCWHSVGCFFFESTIFKIFEFSPTKNIGSPTIFDGLFFSQIQQKTCKNIGKNKKKPTTKIGFFCQSLTNSCHFWVLFYHRNLVWYYNNFDISYSYNLISCL